MPLAIIFYFLVRQVCDAHQLLIWHRAEIESSGGLVISILMQTHHATERVMVGLIISQASVFFKQLFIGNFWSISYVFVMTGFTSAFFYILNKRPLITPDKFPDGEEKLDTANLQKWWNSFSHPMTVKAETRLDQTASLLCRV